jgi:hypothetical protein
MKWTWDEGNKTWISGGPNLGCGVYETDRGWEGNVVIYNMIYGLSPKPTMEAVMAEAESRFDTFSGQYHEEVN